MTQMIVMSGAERRRKWCLDQKRAIVADAFSGGSSVLAVAQREDVCTALIYRWRKDLGSAGGPSFSRVVVTPESRASLDTPTGQAAIVVELGLARVMIGAGATAALVTATLKALHG